LNNYKFPLFDERLQHQPLPIPAAVLFADKVKSADGVINCHTRVQRRYPASIKNVVDLLYNEWHRKPVAISTVSDGSFGGSQVIISLQFTLWKIRAWTVPAMFPVPEVNKAFDESGNPADKQKQIKEPPISLMNYYGV